MSYLTWVNHSTFLIEYRGLVILTDPIFSLRCSPISLLGPKRYHEPGIALSEIKKIDLVLISHTHYDHLDYTSIRQILKSSPHATFVVPYRFGWWFRLCGAKNVVTLKPKEQKKLIVDGHEIVCSAVPARHATNRYIVDLGLVKSMGIVLKIDQAKSFYFVGDTAFDRKIAEYAKTLGPIDMNLVPIGAYLPRFIFKKMHMDPFEALQFHILTGAKRAVASHWKTFKLTWEHPERAKEDLLLALERSNGTNPLFHAIDPGEKISW